MNATIKVNEWSKDSSQHAYYLNLSFVTDDGVTIIEPDPRQGVVQPDRKTRILRFIIQPGNETPQVFDTMIDSYDIGWEEKVRIEVVDKTNRLITTGEVIYIHADGGGEDIWES